jgi:3-deoxy-D-arabino-heptulosonate 7-phosphate (DAHP) synthase class II
MSSRTVRIRYVGGIRDGEVYNRPTGERVAEYQLARHVTSPGVATIYKFHRWLSFEDGCPVAEFHSQNTSEKDEAFRFLTAHKDCFIEIPTSESDVAGA